MPDLKRAAAIRPAILQIIPRLDAGGAERATIDMARALTMEGYRALVASEGGRMEGELRAAGGTLIRMKAASKNPLTILANGRRLADIIGKENVVLMHARSRAPAWSAYLAARRTRVRFVTTYHGIYNAKSAAKRFYNSVMARGDAVIANSEWTARHIERTYPQLMRRPVVIPRGIDLQRFDPASVAPERSRPLRKAWEGTGGPVVLLPGRLTRWKGQLVFIEALGHLKREGRLPRGLRAVLAGDAQGRDAYAREIDAAIEAGGLGDVVLKAGHVDDMPAAYLASDVVVSASTEPEAFGRIAVEAGAMERPVIATAHGGSSETIRDGVTGFLVPPGDAAALGDAIARVLMLSQERWRKMGERARDHVAQHYSVERMCAATLAVYRELL